MEVNLKDGSVEAEKREEEGWEEEGWEEDERSEEISEEGRIVDDTVDCSEEDEREEERSEEGGRIVDDKLKLNKFLSEDELGSDLGFEFWATSRGWVWDDAKEFFDNVDELEDEEVESFLFESFLFEWFL